MRSKINIYAVALFFLTSLCVSAAHAQSAEPDKSQYTLFDPVPDSLMRDFSTDRPPKANVPYTVDAGPGAAGARYLSHGETRAAICTIAQNPWLLHQSA
jgi:hypothetical protein